MLRPCGPQAAIHGNISGTFSPGPVGKVRGPGRNILKVQWCADGVVGDEMEQYLILLKHLLSPTRSDGILEFIMQFSIAPAPTSGPRWIDFGLVPEMRDGFWDARLVQGLNRRKAGTAPNSCHRPKHHVGAKGVVQGGRPRRLVAQPAPPSRSLIASWTSHSDTRTRPVPQSRPALNCTRDAQAIIRRELADGLTQSGTPLPRRMILGLRSA